MAQQTKKRKRRVKRKVRVSTKAKVRKKSEQPKDTIPKAPARLYRDAGANFKIKIRRK